MSGKGQRLGYVRVSTVDQNTARQWDGEKTVSGIPCDKVFCDKVSGKDTERPQLLALLDFAREGDEVIVHSMDRLARNLDDLRRVVFSLMDRGIAVSFGKEGLRFVPGDDSPMAKLMLSMMGAVAEFERSMILERQREGIAAAKAEGKYRGRQPSLTPLEVATLKARKAEGVAVSQLAKDFGISRQSVYNYLEA